MRKRPLTLVLFTLVLVFIGHLSCSGGIRRPPSLDTGDTGTAGGTALTVSGTVLIPAGAAATLSSLAALTLPPLELVPMTKRAITDTITAPANTLVEIFDSQWQLLASTSTAGDGTFSTSIDPSAPVDASNTDNYTLFIRSTTRATNDIVQIRVVSLAQSSTTALTLDEALTDVGPDPDSSVIALFCSGENLLTETPSLDVDPASYDLCSEFVRRAEIPDLEICDGVDNDSDGQIDEGFDADGDGVTTCAGDCDDTDETIQENCPGDPQQIGTLILEGRPRVKTASEGSCDQYSTDMTVGGAIAIQRGCFYCFNDGNMSPVDVEGALRGQNEDGATECAEFLDRDDLIDNIGNSHCDAVAARGVILSQHDAFSAALDGGEEGYLFFIKANLWKTPDDMNDYFDNTLWETDLGLMSSLDPAILSGDLARNWGSLYPSSLVTCLRQYDAHCLSFADGLRNTLSDGGDLDDLITRYGNVDDEFFSVDFDDREDCGMDFLFDFSDGEICVNGSDDDGDGDVDCDDTDCSECSACEAEDGNNCGDGFCIIGEEDAVSCPADCGGGGGEGDPCGDGSCDYDSGENNPSSLNYCPLECPCGDGSCSPGDGEDSDTCPIDCGGHGGSMK